MFFRTLKCFKKTLKIYFVFNNERARGDKKLVRIVKCHSKRLCRVEGIKRFAFGVERVNMTNVADKDPTFVVDRDRARSRHVRLKAIQEFPVRRKYANVAFLTVDRVNLIVSVDGYIFETESRIGFFGGVFEFLHRSQKNALKN